MHAITKIDTFNNANLFNGQARLQVGQQKFSLVFTKSYMNWKLRHSGRKRGQRKMSAWLFMFLPETSSVTVDQNFFSAGW